MDIRLLIKQLDKGVEFTELDLESLENEVNFLNELKEIVDSFNKAINELYSTKKEQDYKVCIFDGRNDKKFGRDFNVAEKSDDTKAQFGNKLKLLTNKRFLISEHLE